MILQIHAISLLIIAFYFFNIYRLDEINENAQACPDLVGGARPPLYGREIDEYLADACRERRQVGLPLDDFLLRQLLEVKLHQSGQQHLLNRPGAFGISWAARFWARHNLKVRVGTTKMRVASAEDDENASTYLDILTEVCT